MVRANCRTYGSSVQPEGRALAEIGDGTAKSTAYPRSLRTPPRPVWPSPANRSAEVSAPWGHSGGRAVPRTPGRTIRLRSFRQAPAPAPLHRDTSANTTEHPRRARGAYRPPPVPPPAPSIPGLRISYGDSSVCVEPGLHRQQTRPAIAIGERLDPIPKPLEQICRLRLSTTASGTRHRPSLHREESHSLDRSSRPQEMSRRRGAGAAQPAEHYRSAKREDMAQAHPGGAKGDGE